MSAFDDAVEHRKTELRVERWKQILCGERKPNAMQDQILRQEMRFKLVLISIGCIIVYLIY